MVDVILPCLDEAPALPVVLAGLPPGYRAIVVDNGSGDGAAAVALRCGAIVVPERRRGFGWACPAGLDAATSDVVAFGDADASLDLRELPRVVGPVVGARSTWSSAAEALVARGPGRCTPGWRTGCSPTG